VQRKELGCRESQTAGRWENKTAASRWRMETYLLL